MKDKNPLQLFRLHKWKKEHLRNDFGYNGLLVYMGRTRKTEKQLQPLEKYKED